MSFTLLACRLFGAFFSDNDNFAALGVVISLLLGVAHADCLSVGMALACCWHRWICCGGPGLGLSWIVLRLRPAGDQLKLNRLFLNHSELVFYS